MSSTSLSRSALRAVRTSQRSAVPRVQSAAIASPSRQFHQPSTSHVIASSQSRRRPNLQQPQSRCHPAQQLVARRTIFIQTEGTPNENALKFKPNTRILPENISSPFLEYLSPRSTLQPPHPSPLAAQLLAVDGVTSIFFGVDYITITKEAGVPWPHIKPEVFSLVTEAVTSGQPIVNTIEGKGEDGDQGMEQDSLTYDENDTEVVSMIKELLETRIRPAIQEDGGDIEFRGFHPENGMVLLKLRGACRTCDSSTVTLKNGIESMLMHYIEEVKGVEQVLDQEEEIAMTEFAKFEEKLRQTKGDVPPTSPGKGSIDTIA
ncbi:NifU-related protein [Aulographum hederae CBS 113979]|uniref:NifU-related protein n=1 Tax=Aulographum hederae CBS 113979 TaxID=1176131 RepID=A0A6G1H7L4_9PEZI|nr:NifU-related protein [Aulographum hederae CBS 113979]